jgi:hypothetical protein
MGDMVSSFLRFLDHTTTHHSPYHFSGQVISLSHRPLSDKKNYKRQASIPFGGIFFIALVSSVSCTFCSSVLFVSYRTAYCGFFHYEKLQQLRSGANPRSWVPEEIRTQNPNKRGVADPQLRSCGHWDRTFDKHSIGRTFILTVDTIPPD